MFAWIKIPHAMHCSLFHLSSALFFNTYIALIQCLFRNFYFDYSIPRFKITTTGCPWDNASFFLDFFYFIFFLSESSYAHFFVSFQNSWNELTWTTLRAGRGVKLQCWQCCWSAPVTLSLYHQPLRPPASFAHLLALLLCRVKTRYMADPLPVRSPPLIFTCWLRTLLGAAKHHRKTRQLPIG